MRRQDVQAPIQRPSAARATTMGVLRVTSQRFAEQDEACQRWVLSPEIRVRVPAGAGIAQGWREFTGDTGECVSLECFGASAFYPALYQQFGLRREGVAAAARSSTTTTTGREGRRTP